MDIGEFGLIARLMGEAKARDGVVVAIGDDAAVVKVTPDCNVVFTCDCMVEDVHFLRTATGYNVGYKLMASNISDIAAMGGRPRYAVITLVTPADEEVAWLEDIYTGIKACAAQYGCQVVGGDTSRGPKVVLSVAMLGEVLPGREMLRSGAQPGDLVCVSGPLGASHAGLQVELGRIDASAACASEARLRHFRPVVPVDLAVTLGELGCRCANDISDGLASEAREIAVASRVGLELDSALLPIAPEALAIAHALGEKPGDYALYGGEEYALLFCVPALLSAEVCASYPAVQIIGRVTDDEGVFLLHQGERERLRAAYTHFD
ncbi:MAG: Thiamine-monophosphate kinase [Firmicutes bacterium]|nr:Thiamine-monophosphate kinase [candidate division NPL-UPA2 bacterium]